MQRRKGQSLVYELIGETGPDHDKQFAVRVLLNGKPIGEGSGTSKKRAEQSAAREAVEKLYPEELEAAELGKQPAAHHESTVMNENRSAGY